MLKLAMLAILALFVPTGIGIALVSVSRFKRWIDLRLQRAERKEFQENMRSQIED